MNANADTIERPVRTIRRQRDQHNDPGTQLFGVLWDAERITWGADDVPDVR